MSRPGRTPENPAAVTDEERARVLREAGVEPKPRRYLAYDYVTLVHAIASTPPRQRTLDSFPGKEYRFFVEAGMFCIECRQTGVVLEVPPAQLRVARRAAAPKDAEP